MPISGLLVIDGIFFTSFFCSKKRASAHHIILFLLMQHQLQHLHVSRCKYQLGRCCCFNSRSWDCDRPNYTNQSATGHKTAANWSPMRITIKLWLGRQLAAFGHRQLIAGHEWAPKSIPLANHLALVLRKPELSTAKLIKLSNSNTHITFQMFHATRSTNNNHLLIFIVQTS